MRISDWSSDVCSSDLLWTGLGDRSDYPLITAKWPEPKTERDADASDSVDWLIKLITEIRSARSEMNIAPSAKTEIVVHNDHRIEGRSEEHTSELQSLMRISYAVFCLKQKTHPEGTEPNPHCNRHTSNSKPECK